MASSIALESIEILIHKDPRPTEFTNETATISLQIQGDSVFRSPHLYRISPWLKLIRTATSVVSNRLLPDSLPCYFETRDRNVKERINQSLSFPLSVSSSVIIGGLWVF
jgi:hypothetical protein